MGFAMTMAAAIEERPADQDARPQAARIAGIDIIRDLTAAEGIWRGMENALTSFTPYIRFEFLGSCQRHVGTR